MAALMTSLAEINTALVAGFASTNQQIAAINQRLDAIDAR